MVNKWLPYTAAVPRYKSTQEPVTLCCGRAYSTLKSGIVNTENIVQFVCFASPLGTNEFKELWEPYAKILVKDPAIILLQEGVSDQKSTRFTYISQHACSAADFQFAFMKGKSKSHFPEHKARVIQAGGYLPVAPVIAYKQSRADVKIIALVGHGETDPAFYRGLGARHMNMYEAYYENCLYGYVIEFFTSAKEANDMLSQLKERPGVEAGIYQACLFSRTVRKVSGSLS